jgi:hypothetical protein
MAFLKLDADAVRAVAAAMPVASILRVRLRVIAGLLPQLPSDVVFDPADGDGLVPDDVAAERADDAAKPGEESHDPWPVGKPKMVNPPFGWRRHGQRVVKAKEEQEILRRVCQGTKKGWSNAQIAEDLNGRSLTTRRNSKWDGSGIGRLRKGALSHAMNAKLKERYG